jgi:hypothetical protein
MRLAPDTVSEARRLIEVFGSNIDAARHIRGIGPATLSDIAHDKTNVSREMENKLRRATGMSILPSIEKVEVPPGKTVKIVDLNKEPRKPRRRKPRYSVPADPKEAGKYLGKKLTGEEVDALVESLLDTYGDTTHGQTERTG